MRMFSKNLNLIKHYQFDISNPKSLQTSIVTSLLEKDNRLWVGSGGDGVFIYNSESDGFIKKDLNNGLSSGIINKLFSIKNILFAYTQQGLNYMISGDTYFKSIDSDDGLVLANFDDLNFSKLNDKLIIESKQVQFSIDLSMLSESTSKSEVVVKEIIGIDSKNNQHLLAFTNNLVDVPPYITSINISVSFPSLYKAKQNIYSYSYDSSNDAEIYTKKAGEVISIAKRGYSDKILNIQSAGLIAAGVTQLTGADSSQFINNISSLMNSQMSEAIAEIMVQDMYAISQKINELSQERFNEEIEFQSDLIRKKYTNDEMLIRMDDPNWEAYNQELSVLYENNTLIRPLIEAGSMFDAIETLVGEENLNDELISDLGKTMGDMINYGFMPSDLSELDNESFSDSKMSGWVYD